MKITTIKSTVIAGLILTINISSFARLAIQNKGSDTLVNGAQAWAEEYSKKNKNVAVAVSGGGSGTGIAAMINGTVDIANASRKMKAKEIKLAKSKGQNPIEHVVGFDALAVYVHKSNPKKNISIPTLARIFGRKGTVKKWNQLGITIPGCPSDKIVAVSRQNNSGTYAYFKKIILGKKGKYRMGTLDMHGSKDVVDLVEKTPCAIGYSGLAYATEHVGVGCISKSEDGNCVMPSVKTAINKTYPIARPLFMYTNGEPKGEIKVYLDWIKSNTGQCIILKKGYAPIKNGVCS